MASRVCPRQLALCVVQLHQDYRGETTEEINPVHTRPTKGKLVDPGAESFQKCHQGQLDYGAERI